MAEQLRRQPSPSNSTHTPLVAGSLPFGDASSEEMSTVMFRFSRRSPPPLADSPTTPMHKDKRPKKAVRIYYKKQQALLENFKTDSERIQDVTVSDEDEFEPPLKVVVLEGGDGAMSTERIDLAHLEASAATKKSLQTVERFARITLFIHIVLIFGKAVASFRSGSLSILSALVDSAVDITFGLAIYLTSHAIKKHDPYAFPRGRTRLQPLALIIVSVAVGVASVQLLVQAVRALESDLIDPHVDMVSLVIMMSAIFARFSLMLICQRSKSNRSISVLAQDHRNGCISNAVALACACLASEVWIYLDLIGTVFVSIFIASNACKTGMEHIRMISGRTASPEFINRIIMVCLDHDSRIQFIDTVHVYHFGTRYLVEVHIVLDERTPLKTAHDISEELQAKIESLPEIERAFVHTDYECEHQPVDEHKVV